MSWAEREEHQIYAYLRMKGASVEKALEAVGRWRAYEQLCGDEGCDEDLWTDEEELTNIEQEADEDEG